MDQAFDALRLRLRQPKSVMVGPRAVDTTPSEDHLICPEEMRRVLTVSGYLLEGRIADVLRGRGLYVERNLFRAHPRDESKSIEIDVSGRFGEVFNDEGRSSVIGELLIECKNNSQPVTFFLQSQAVREINDGHIQYEGQASSPSYRLVAADTAGAGNFRVDSPNIDLEFYYSITVFQGPIYEARVGGGEIDLRRTDHLQFHHSASFGGRVYRAQIDVVSEQAFSALMATIQDEVKKIASGIRALEQRCSPVPSTKNESNERG